MEKTTKISLEVPEELWERAKAAVEKANKERVGRISATTLVIVGLERVVPEAEDGRHLQWEKEPAPQSPSP